MPFVANMTKKTVSEMVETSFDVDGIEYLPESDFAAYKSGESDDLWNWDYWVNVSVDVPDEFKDKHFSFTEDLIRDYLKTHISQRLGEPVVVVDFTAFYAGTDKPLRGNYEDYDTHGEYAFMQAEQEKLHPGLYRYKGKIGLRKGWTECQTCDDLVKLNDINWYYLKGYGQATVCDSCVGKYNYKKDRLSKGGRHGEVAILQFMEQDRKEAETFEATQVGYEGSLVPGMGMETDDNPDVQWVTDPHDPDQHTIAVPLDWVNPNAPPPPQPINGGGGGIGVHSAETFEARGKKIGSITIKKNPNFPSGTHLQAYIKTNRAELRKVFGNPNMGESGDGKSKGKEWNLIVGGKRVTIYDYREKGIRKAQSISISAEMISMVHC